MVADATPATVARDYRRVPFQEFPLWQLQSAYYPSMATYVPYSYTPEAYYGLSGYIRYPTVFGPNNLVRSQITAPPACQSDAQGAQLVQFMASNAAPGTGVGAGCCPGTVESTKVLSNDHSSGTSVGVRWCKRFAMSETA